MIKGEFNRYDIKILNVYAPNNKTSKCVRQKEIKRNEEIFFIASENFKSPLDKI